VLFLVGEEKLRGNPLGDPLGAARGGFSPRDNTAAERPLPLVIYLPGWGGLGGGRDQSPGKMRGGAAVIDELVRRELPVRLAVIDGRSRYGRQPIPELRGDRQLRGLRDGRPSCQPIEARYALSKEGGESESASLPAIRAAATAAP